MPPLPHQFTLTQVKPKNYANIDECLLTEIDMPKSRLQDIITQHRNDYRWEKIKNVNLKENLKDINNPLTEDERFAIALYTSELTKYFYNTLSYYLHTGRTGSFNCYFQYMRSGFDKLKNIEKNVHLYRGVEQTNELVLVENYKYNDIVQTTSFTSSSFDYGYSLYFARSGLVFDINATRNPKNISMLSFAEKEQELLFPPATKFRVSKNTYADWYYIYSINGVYRIFKEIFDDCVYNEFYHCQYINYSYIYFVYLEEIDEDYGPILTVDENEIKKVTKEHLGVPYWGWLIIGVGVGAVILAIIWISLIIYQKKQKQDNSSENESNIANP